VSDGYFAEPDGVPTAAATWFSLLAGPGADVADGIVSRPVAGDGVMLTHVTWQRDAVAPVHAHAEEQLLLLIEGEVELTVSGQPRTMQAGDVVVLPPWTPHGGRGLAERSVAIEAFAPLRAQLLALAPEPQQMNTELPSSGQTAREK
jgi:quercetin dioxygenase-like cupin family protein